MRTPKNRTLPEHLVDLTVAADAIRRRALGWQLSRFKPTQRRWIEPGFNFLGRLFALVLRALPWPLRRRVDLWINLKISGHPSEFNPQLVPMVDQTIALAGRLKRETGQWPALLLLTSHPVTIGPLQWLRFELIRQALVIANAVADAERPGAWFRPAPQCFLAIDPYALDTVPPAVGGFYAGWMNGVFIGWDRQPSTQSWIQRAFLLRGSGHDRIAWRLFRRLRKNPVVMVVSGGLPHNARMLYAAREFMQRRKPGRWPYPKRDAEAKLLKILMSPVDGVRPAEDGTLPAETEKKIDALLGELGFSEAAVRDALREFKEEFALEVPYRTRLFNALARRVVGGGTPLLCLAVGHRKQAPHVRIAEPAVIVKEGRTVTFRIAGDATTDVLVFAKRFSRLFDFS